jgi:PAS domain S-box-containing protein
MEFRRKEGASSDAEIAQAHLAAIVHSSDDAIISKDLQGVVTTWNPAAERIFGYKAEEMIGQPIVILIPTERSNEEPGILERINRGEHIEHYETVRRRKDGQLIDVSLTVSPIRDATGKIIGASKIARDISERKRTQQALHQERERMKVTLASIGDAIIVTDAAGLVTFLNPVAETLTGWTNAEAEGKRVENVFNIVNELTREPVERPVTEVLREKRVVGLANHTVLIAKDGTERAIDDSGAPIRGADGSVVGVVMVFRDVTSQRAAQEAQTRLAAIIESSDDAIVGKDLTGRVTSWNQGAERIFGYAASEMIGQHISRIIPPERLQEEPEILERLKRGERVDHFETVRRAKDGRQVHVSLTISPIRNAEGEIVGASKIARDITDRKKIERELKRYSEELENKVAERTAELEAFSYSVSHDLRAPLRAMHGFADLLLQQYAPQLDAEGQDYLQRIKRSGTRLNQLIESILAYSRVSRMNLELRSIELDKLVPQVLDEYLNLNHADADVQIKRPLAAVRANEPLLTQCISNLVSNAIKFVRPGERPRIHIATEPKESSVRLSVTDNGIGVTPENQDRIFDLFTRVHSLDAYAGSGIGLAIVERAVTRMGGKVGLNSEPHKGSTFWIELPKAGNGHS